MKRADYHIHSQFSPDSMQTIEVACERAIQLGLDELCFTDHLEFAVNAVVDYERYRQAIEQARERYGYRLILKMGLEVGFDPKSRTRVHEYLHGKEFDFLIGSLHWVNGYDLFNGEFFADKGIDQALREYLTALHKAISSFQFSVLGHMTLVKRFFSRLNVNSSDLNWQEYDDLIKAILQDLITEGKGIELNLRVPLIDWDFRILGLYRELGGEIITLGTDAHHPRSMHTMEEGFEALRKTGFRYYCIFEKQKPVFVKI